MADLHVPIRPGSDIAFLGGIVNYIFEHDAWFEEYVRAFTNGPVIIKPEFADTEDGGGLLLGLESRGPRLRDQHVGIRGDSGEATAGKSEQVADVSGEQAHGAHGMKLPGGEPPELDDSMQDPDCVLQLVRRHFARYTPQLVAELCGCSEEEFVAVARAMCENSGRERTSSIVYAVGWTQHTIGRPEHPRGLDRAAAAGQHRPARRRHPGAARSRQHPGLDRHPDAVQHPAGVHPDAASAAASVPGQFVELNGPDTGAWGDLRPYMVSLLKAWWGDAATADNDYCFDYLPRSTATTRTTR